jgi:hypothetical protein
MLFMRSFLSGKLVLTIFLSAPRFTRSLRKRRCSPLHEIRPRNVRSQRRKRQTIKKNSPLKIYRTKEKKVNSGSHVDGSVEIKKKAYKKKVANALFEKITFRATEFFLVLRLKMLWDILYQKKRPFYGSDCQANSWQHAPKSQRQRLTQMVHVRPP